MMNPMGKQPGIRSIVASSPVSGTGKAQAGPEAEFNASFETFALDRARTPRQGGGPLGSLAVPHGAQDDDEVKGPAVADAANSPARPTSSRPANAAIAIAVRDAAGDIHAVLRRLKNPDS